MLLVNTADQLQDVTAPCSPAAQKDSQLSACLRDPRAYHLLLKVVQDGLLKADPELGNRFVSCLDTIANAELTDLQAVSALRMVLRSDSDQARIKKSFQCDESKRIERRVNQIAPSLVGAAPQSMLDVGCGNGKITEALAKILNISRAAAFGSDVVLRPDTSSGYTHLSQDSEHIPLEDAAVDCATAFMLLHHEEDADKLICEIHRVLKDGGLLIVREHDANSSSQRLFCIALDLLYYSVFNDLKNIPVPANYQATDHWLSLIERQGFQLLELSYPEPDNPNRPFHAVFKKVS